MISKVIRLHGAYRRCQLFCPSAQSSVSLFQSGATNGHAGLLYSGDFTLLGVQLLCTLTILVYSATFGLLALVVSASELFVATTSKNPTMLEYFLFTAHQQEPARLASDRLRGTDRCRRHRTRSGWYERRPICPGEAAQYQVRYRSTEYSLSCHGAPNHDEL